MSSFVTSGTTSIRAYLSTYLCSNVEKGQEEGRGEKEKSVDKAGTTENPGEAKNVQRSEYCKLIFVLWVESSHNVFILLQKRDGSFACIGDQWQAGINNGDSSFGTVWNIISESNLI